VSFDEHESTAPVQTRDIHRVVFPRVRLEVLEGQDRGAKHEVVSGTVTVGTSEECELRLCDRSVSRRHVSFSPEPDGVRVRDHSRNGTFWAGNRIFDLRLASEVSLQLGETILRVQPTGETVACPLSTRIRFGDAVGASAAMRRIFALLEQAARSSVTVLFEGDSGTGKDVLARALHQESPRKDGPFVVIDCGAVPEQLIESELFGHEKGAFTGATQLRAGAFEQADGGTVFLDEIGELPLAMQPKLLRVLESRSFRRVGGNKDLSVDVRVVAATNRRLAESVRKREFREDLYYRLAVVLISVPRLAERVEDIPVLADGFYRRILNNPAAVLPEELRDLLQSYAWPGNARELRNVVERFATFGQRDPVALFGGRVADPNCEIVAPEGLLGLPYHEARQRTLESFHRTYLTRELEISGGSVAAAAERLGIPRTSLYRMLQRQKREDDGDAM
jgi:DNA-binding NtrC family response regulator